MLFFFFSSRRRHTRYWRDWSSDVCSSDLSPDWPEIRYNEADRWRPSVNGAIQWRPSPGVEFYVDGLWQGYREDVTDRMRSEERRVGKECRSRWSPYH